jgi:predicted esterase
MRLLTCLIVLLVPLSASGADKATKKTFGSGGRTRTYYLLVPESAKKAGSPPLIVLLHGSGRDGKSLIDPWTSLAKKEGIVLVAPDAMTPQGWRVPDDGPDFLHDLVELLANQIEIDRQRVYIFGHSAGAGHGLVMALLESEYFAAVAVHAGMLPESSYQMLDRAARKTPIAMWIGTEDALFPLAVVRATRDALKAHGFHPELTELAAHTHKLLHSRRRHQRRGLEISAADRAAERTTLRALPVLALAFAIVPQTSGMSRDPLDAIVLGVGGMGSAALLHLARRNPRVLGLEQFQIPHEHGSSHGLTRIIRLAYWEHPAYVPLLRRAYELWHELEALAGEQLLVTTGSVDAGPPVSVPIRGVLKACRQFSLRHENVRQFNTHQRFPGYRLPNDLSRSVSTDGGFLLSERCITAHLNAALQLGATVHTNERVVDWEVAGDHVRVRTDRATYTTRRLIITAGPWAGKIVSALRPLVTVERQVVMWLTPRRPDLFMPGRFPVFYLHGGRRQFLRFPCLRRPRLQDRPVSPPAPDCGSRSC